MMKKLLDGIESILRIFIGVALCIMTASILWQVILRYAFGKANVWAEELARFSFVWLVMCGSAIAVRRSRHMNIDFVKNRLPEHIQNIIMIASTVLCIIFTLVLCIHGYKLLSITCLQLSGGMRIPMSYPYLAIPVGGVIMIAFFIEYLATSLIKPTS